MQYAVNITHCQALESQHKAPIAIAFGVCLALGVFCSYIPQIGKIIVRRSSLGIAFLYLITASFQNYASTLNVVMVSMPDLVCCSVVSAGTCGDLLLPVFQIGSPVFQLLIVYVLFLVFHPSRMAVEVALQTAVQKTEDVEVLSSSSSSGEPKFFSRIGAWVAKHEFGISLLGFIFYIFLALIIFSAIGLYIDLTDGDSSSSARFYARVMGFVAVALNIAQWAPQIWVWLSAFFSSSFSSLAALPPHPPFHRSLHALVTLVH